MNVQNYKSTRQESREPSQYCHFCLLKTTMLRLIIIDRDGVINQDSDHYIKSPKEWISISGSLEAIAQLHKAGYKVAVATNQSGIARGYFDLATLEMMHAKMHGLLAEHGGRIDCVAFCTDHPNQATNRRKPGPGMLIEISQKLDLPLSTALFIGDSYSDYLAARNGQCDFVLVRTGKGEKTLLKHPELLDLVPIYDNLAAFVETLLAQPEEEQ